jgi:hypothetical protein
VRRLGGGRRKCRYPKLEFCGVWPSADDPRYEVKRTTSWYVLESKDELRFSSSTSRIISILPELVHLELRSCSIQGSYQGGEINIMNAPETNLQYSAVAVSSLSYHRPEILWADEWGCMAKRGVRHREIFGIELYQPGASPRHPPTSRLSILIASDIVYPSDIFDVLPSLTSVLTSAAPLCPQMAAHPSRSPAGAVLHSRHCKSVAEPPRPQ